MNMNRIGIVYVSKCQVYNISSIDKCKNARTIQILYRSTARRIFFLLLLFAMFFCLFLSFWMQTTPAKFCTVAFEQASFLGKTSEII